MNNEQQPECPKKLNKEVSKMSDDSKKVSEIKVVLKAVQDDIDVIALAELTGQTKLANIHRAFVQIKKIVARKS